MESLFKDLGIFKFDNDNDPSLKQGLEFDRYQKDYLDASRYELLERSTTSSLSLLLNPCQHITLITTLQLNQWKV